MKEPVSQDRVGTHGGPYADYTTSDLVIVVVFCVGGFQVFLNSLEVRMDLLETTALVQI